MKKKLKFPKNIESEESLKKYLKNNKEYVLKVLSENQYLWKDERFVCDSTILMFAMRYALGRKTGAVDRLVNWILEEWDRISTEDRIFMVKEIIEYEKHYGNLGFEWNREQWYRIVNKHLYGLIDEMQ